MSFVKIPDFKMGDERIKWDLLKQEQVKIIIKVSKIAPKVRGFITFEGSSILHLNYLNCFVEFIIKPAIMLGTKKEEDYFLNIKPINFFELLSIVITIKESSVKMSKH